MKKRFTGNQIVAKLCQVDYDYLSGKTDMGGEKVAILCKELGLTLKRSKGRK